MNNQTISNVALFLIFVAIGGMVGMIGAWIKVNYFPSNSDNDSDE